MLDYSFFYDLAKYCNDTWKGCFTEKEIAEIKAMSKQYEETRKQLVKNVETINALMGR